MIFSNAYLEKTGKKREQTNIQKILENSQFYCIFCRQKHNFVREKLNGSLPHPKTISKWYCNVDAAPGFSKETFEMIQTRVKYSKNKKMLCSLVFDEMGIRKYVEWNGDHYYGLVDLDSGISYESMGLASQVLAFMLVSVDESWKIPFGYFLLIA